MAFYVVHLCFRWSFEMQCKFQYLFFLNEVNCIDFQCIKPVSRFPITKLTHSTGFVYSIHEFSVIGQCESKKHTICYQKSSFLSLPQVIHQRDYRNHRKQSIKLSLLRKFNQNYYCGLALSHFDTVQIRCIRRASQLEYDSKPFSSFHIRQTVISLCHSHTKSLLPFCPFGHKHGKIAVRSFEV